MSSPYAPPARIRTPTPPEEHEIDIERPRAVFPSRIPHHPAYLDTPVYTKNGNGIPPDSAKGIALLIGVIGTFVIILGAGENSLIPVLGGVIMFFSGCVLYNTS